MHVTFHHRFGERYPENTVRAAALAAADADAVEVDVRRCETGELVASHFEHVRVVADGGGRAATSRRRNSIRRACRARTRASGNSPAS